MPSNICWLGWSGIRPAFRRRGFGRAAMIAVCDFATHLGSERWDTLSPPTSTPPSVSKFSDRPSNRLQDEQWTTLISY
jgi:hypothetical protein